MSDYEELGSELTIQHTGQVFPLTEETVTIGSGEDNVIVLADPKVSSQHATISLPFSRAGQCRHEPPSGWGDGRI